MSENWNLNKVEKYEEKFRKVQESYAELLKINKKYEETIKNLEIQAADLQKEHSFIKKSVLSWGKEEDLSMYNPFELHQRMRYFECMYNYNLLSNLNYIFLKVWNEVCTRNYKFSHSEQLKAQNKLDEVIRLLNIAGLTINSLKDGIASGWLALNINKWNTSGFKSKSKERTLTHYSSTSQKDKDMKNSDLNNKLNVIIWKFYILYIITLEFVIK